MTIEWYVTGRKLLPILRKAHYSKRRVHMSEITITATIVVAGGLAAILLWQVLEIGKERARSEDGEGGELVRRVEQLEVGLESLKAHTPGEGR